MKAKQEKVLGKDLNTFQQTAQRKDADKFAEVKSAGVAADNQISQIDDAISAFKNYVQTSPGGTGPLATVGGLTKYVSEDTQNLEAKFRTVNLQNLAKTFQGMSKAIDSDVERRAWESTQPSLSNDDKVNANILLGAKALAIKARAEGIAQREWVKQHKNLDEYESPILGKTVVVVSPDGEMELVPTASRKIALERGYSTLDEYAKKQILRLGKKDAAESKSEQAATEIFASDEDAIKEAQKIKAKGKSDPEYEGAIRFLQKMGVK
jgi:hypothetical protein